MGQLWGQTIDIFKSQAKDTGPSNQCNGEPLKAEQGNALEIAFGENNLAAWRNVDLLRGTELEGRETRQKCLIPGWLFFCWKKKPLSFQQTAFHYDTKAIKVVTYIKAVQDVLSGFMKSKQQ